MLVFFDDILVYNKTVAEHCELLQVVMQKLQGQQLYANKKKCEFGKEVGYLGHVISRKGVAMDQSNVDAMLCWPQPRTITQLRGFLGLTGYYRKFIAKYGQIARPLTDLLKKTKNWME